MCRSSWIVVKGVLEYFRVQLLMHWRVMKHVVCRILEKFILHFLIKVTVVFNILRTYIRLLCILLHFLLILKRMQFNCRMFICMCDISKMTIWRTISFGYNGLDALGYNVMSYICLGLHDTLSLRSFEGEKAQKAWSIIRQMRFFLLCTKVRADTTRIIM